MKHVTVYLRKSESKSIFIGYAHHEDVVTNSRLGGGYLILHDRSGEITGYVPRDNIATITVTVGADAPASEG